jgi:hypothetical protein
MQYAHKQTDKLIYRSIDKQINKVVSKLTKRDDNQLIYKYKKSSIN